MDPIVFLKPPKIDPAVWRPDVPLIVLEKCLAPGTVRVVDKDGARDVEVDPTKLICVWLAIRWLMAAFPKRRGFGTRLIARRAGVNQKYITRWAAKLIELGLLEHVGEEAFENLHAGNPRPVYAIPLDRLERISNEIALSVLSTWSEPDDNSAPQSPDQLSFDARLLDAESSRGSDPIRDHGSDPIRDHGSDPIRDHGSDPIRDHGSDPIRDHMGGRIHGREGGLAPAAKKTTGSRPGRPPTIPPAPDGQPPLSAHPTALWAKACGQPRATDPDQLATLAAAHDIPTDGYGAYWVGRAILAATLDADVRSLRKVRAILDRWQAEGAYGSDRYTTEHRHGPRTRSRADAPAARAGTDGAAPPVRAPVRRSLDYERPPE